MRLRKRRQRKYMLESFTAGWQAALAVNITNPRVLDVVEACFDMYLEDAIDERVILGLHFARRRDLPKPSGKKPPWLTADDMLRGHPAPRPAPREVPVDASVDVHRQLSTRPFVATPAPEPAGRGRSPGKHVRIDRPRNGKASKVRDRLSS
jgi:hypothetical protein